MLIFVQNNHVAANTGRLAAAARSLGVDVADMSFPWEAPPAVPDGERVFPYGSVAFIKALRNDLAWRPHISWSEDAFKARRWSERYGDRYLGHQGQPVDTTDVLAMLPAAVRPLHGDKSFPGGVYTAENWTPPASPAQAWVAPTSSISSEVRVWIIDGRAICAGRYLPTVANFDITRVRDCIDSISPLPLQNIVMDLAETPGGWKLIEFNCINTAGFYAIDPIDLIRALGQ